MNPKITGAAEALRGEMADLVQDMVKIPSVCGNEGAIIEHLEETMKSFGYDEVRVDRFGNLIGRIGSGPKLIAIDGHADTVDVGNPDTWEVDPFGGVLSDGVIYGRGASDQKGGLASAIYAGKILKEIGLPENLTVLVVASVYEEDVEGLCWDYIISKEGVRPEAVVLTEPTDLRLCLGQRGRLEIKVKTTGRSCHGSAPDRGDNAIYKMAPIIQEIDALHRRLESKSVLGKGSITISDIRSTAPSLCAVADSCTIHLDRRLTEGETLESAVQEVKSLPSVESAGAELTVPRYETKTHTGLVYPSDAYFPAWLMEEDHPLVRASADAYQEQFGEKPDVGVWQFSTNGVVTMGAHGIPSIGFGPGEEKHAHTPQDQVRVDDLVKAMAFYAAFVLKIAS